MDDALGTLLIAGLGVILGWMTTRSSYQATIAQYKLSASTAATDWLRDLRTWAAEAIDVLAEASYTCRAGDKPLDEASKLCLERCRHRLSSLIDRGRLFLPNEQEQRVGKTKSRAYRGLRHHALDALVGAERVLAGNISLYEFPDSKSALIGMRREFVSYIQAIIDPHSFNKEVAALLRVASSERAANPTLGGLLPNAAEPPRGEDALMEAASKRGRHLTRPSVKAISQP